MCAIPRGARAPKNHSKGTVPTNKMHPVGTVPKDKMHSVGTVPTENMHPVEMSICLICLPPSPS